jgi:hypothetical protein
MNQRHDRRALQLASAALCLLLLGGCASGPTVRTNVDPAVDFSRFTTFAFMQPLSTDRAGYQSFVSQQLIVSAERELVARGLRRTDADPDLLVNFSADLDQRLRVTQTPSTFHGRQFNHHRRGFYSAWPTYQQTQIRQYTQGTLGIDVVDAARRQLVWEGFAIGRITQQTTDNLGPALDAAVTDIFRDFPLPAK